MNKRIKELAEQAGFYVSNNGTEILISDPHTEDITEVTEKFAELIVKECMSEIEIVRGYKVGNDGPVYTQGFEDGMFVAIRTIEEHFGVQE